MYGGYAPDAAWPSELRASPVSGKADNTKPHTERQQDCRLGHRGEEEVVERDRSGCRAAAVDLISHRDAGAAAGIEDPMQFHEIARPAPSDDVARAARQQPRVVDKDLGVIGVDGDAEIVVR